MKRALIIDDHAVVREGIRSILEDSNQFSTMDEAADAEEGISKAYDNEYDLILLDISMPGKSGLDALPDLKTAQPETPILVLSVYPEQQFAIRMLRAGAAGYLNKQSASDNLMKAVRKVLMGEYYVSPELTGNLVKSLQQDDAASRPHERLTDREYEVLLQYASGLETKEIADKLNISIKTVSAHRTRMLDKMELNNILEAVIYAIKNKLVSGHNFE